MSENRVKVEKAFGLLHNGLFNSIRFPGRKVYKPDGNQDWERTLSKIDFDGSVDSLYFDEDQFYVTGNDLMMRKRKRDEEGNEVEPRALKIGRINTSDLLNGIEPIDERKTISLITEHSDNLIATLEGLSQQDITAINNKLEQLDTTQTGIQNQNRMDIERLQKEKLDRNETRREINTLALPRAEFTQRFNEHITSVEGLTGRVVTSESRVQGILNDFATKDYVQEALVDYATEEQLTSTLSKYLPRDEAEDVLSTVSNLNEDTKTKLVSLFNDYVRRDNFEQFFAEAIIDKRNIAHIDDVDSLKDRLDNIQTNVTNDTGFSRDALRSIFERIIGEPKSRINEFYNAKTIKRDGELIELLPPGVSRDIIDAGSGGTDVLLFSNSHTSSVNSSNISLPPDAFQVRVRVASGEVFLTPPSLTSGNNSSNYDGRQRFWSIQVTDSSLMDPEPTTSPRTYSVAVIYRESYMMFHIKPRQGTSTTDRFKMSFVLHLIKQKPSVDQLINGI